MNYPNRKNSNLYILKELRWKKSESNFVEKPVNAHILPTSSTLSSLNPASATQNVEIIVMLNRAVRAVLGFFYFVH